MKYVSSTLALVASTLFAFTQALPPLSVSEITSLLASLGPAPDNDPRFQKMVPPGPGDVRSPCPGLNTLANHGFLNHSGKNLTIPGMLKGLAEGFNMGADFTVAVGGAGLLSSPFPLLGSFDLNDLDQHNFPIEHDASVSRGDAYFGNDYSFNQTIFNQLLSFYAGKPQTDLLSSSKGRYNRVQQSNKTNPTFTYGFREFIFSYGESAIYLQTMSSPSSNAVANVDYIKMLFENETLPYSLGWRPSKQPITLETLGSQVFDLFTAQPFSVYAPEFLNITAQSYKDVFEIEVGGAEALANLTQGISKLVGF